MSGDVPASTAEHADIVIVGAGAAGLMAAVWAGRAAREAGTPLRIIALDGARKIGAKILVAGGGRCNVTHHAVDASAYAGGSRNAVKNVLRRYDVADTVRFFSELGVDLKREETGKLFPTTDDAHTVLDALLGACADAGVVIRTSHRVDGIERAGNAFIVRGGWGDVRTPVVVLATGGKALPRSGSDGFGYTLAQALGHSITPGVFPALVPLVLEGGSALRTLSGLTLPARLELRAGSGRRLESFTNSTLCTHFGLSGPSAMDISRYYTAARLGDPGTHLIACWLPEASREEAERDLLSLGKRSVGRWARERLPERLADVLLEIAGVEAQTAGSDLRRDERRLLLDAVFEMRLPVVGDRGFTHAEVTAGGVPLDEVDIKTMRSRRCDGLYLCGEILDVDGRIGGFNFQWAWATGHIAGVSAAGALADAASR